MQTESILNAKPIAATHCMISLAGSPPMVLRATPSPGRRPHLEPGKPSVPCACGVRLATLVRPCAPRRLSAHVRPPELCVRAADICAARRCRASTAEAAARIQRSQVHPRPACPRPAVAPPLGTTCPEVLSAPRPRQEQRSPRYTSPAPLPSCLRSALRSPMHARARTHTRARTHACTPARAPRAAARSAHPRATDGRESTSPPVRRQPADAHAEHLLVHLPIHLPQPRACARTDRNLATISSQSRTVCQIHAEPFVFGSVWQTVRPFAQSISHRLPNPC